MVALPSWACRCPLARVVRVRHGAAPLSVIHGSAFLLVRSRPADETDLSAAVPYACSGRCVRHGCPAAVRCGASVAGPCLRACSHVAGEHQRVASVSLRRDCCVCINSESVWGLEMETWASWRMGSALCREVRWLGSGRWVLAHLSHLCPLRLCSGQVSPFVGEDHSWSVVGLSWSA